MSRPRRLMVAAAFAVPGALVWAILGGLAGWWSPAGSALLVTAGYAALYGWAELFAHKPLVPGLSWQVPSTWIRPRGFAVRAAIWGATLGPGLMTRNPLAGMWLMPLMLIHTGGVTAGLVAGAAAGAVHGASRAVGIVRQIRAGEDYDYYNSVLRGLRWRFLDGMLLLAVFGTLAAQLVSG